MTASPHLGDFSVVMATGIVSVALHDAGARALSTAWAVLACAAFALILAAQASALRRHPGALRAELGVPEHLAAGFALPAAAEVLANRLAPGGPSVVLWGAGAAAFAGLWAIAGRAERRPRARPVRPRGTSMLPAVATQGVVLAAPATFGFGGWSGVAGAALVAGWALGLAVYVRRAPAVGADLLRSLRGDPGRREGDDWMLAGGLAISALAGVHVARTLGVRGVTLGVALAAWIAAAAWAVPLAAAEARAAARRALAYRPQRWATVFPLGMLAASAHALGAELPSASLRGAADVLAVVALAAWLLVAAGTARALHRPA